MSLLDYVSRMPDPNSVMGPMPIAQGPPGGKVGGGNGGLFGAIARALMPGQARGLITEDDIKLARKQGLLGLGASLLASGGPSADQRGTLANIGQAIMGGQGAYQDALRSTVGQRGAEQAYRTGELNQQVAQTNLQAQQMELAQAKQLAAGRQAIAAKYGNEPSMADPNFVKYIETVAPEYMRIGDNETLGRLGSFYNMAKSAQTSASQLEARDLGGQIGWYTKQGELVRTDAKTPTPRDPNVMAAADAQRSELSEQRRYQREQGLYTDFQADTKKAGNAMYVLNDTLREKDRALAGDQAAQARLLFGFINSMDDTAVRDGERDMLVKAAPLMQQAEAALSKLNTDKSYILPKDMLANMVGLMDRRHSSNKSYLTHQSKKYQDTARRWDVDVDRFRIVFPGEDEGAAPNASGSSLKQKYGLE